MKPKAQLFILFIGMVAMWAFAQPLPPRLSATNDLAIKFGNEAPQIIYVSVLATNDSDPVQDEALKRYYSSVKNGDLYFPRTNRWVVYSTIVSNHLTLVVFKGNTNQLGIEVQPLRREREETTEILRIVTDRTVTRTEEK